MSREVKRIRGTRALLRFKELQSGPPVRKKYRPVCGDVHKDHIELWIQESDTYQDCDPCRVDAPCIHRVVCLSCGVLLELPEYCPDRRRAA